MENTIDAVAGEEKILKADAYELEAEELLERIILLGFNGDRDLYEKFREMLKDSLPPGTGVTLRGSVVTNARHEDGTPFDSKGENTSDLDVTLIGTEARALWHDDAYYIPALHTKPLGDKDPEIADPRLNHLREELQALVGRPVNIQATANIVMYVRDVLLGQPYFMVIKPEETAEDDAETAQIAQL